MEKNNIYLRWGYIWNSLAGIATGASSVIILMLVRRYGGIELGASFSIAVAIANLTINIGHLNIYGFQISDIKEEYSFQDYFILRVCSVIAMMIVSLSLVVVRDYNKEKVVLILIYCLYRGFFAFFDLFQGRYQQKGRVDLSAKYNFFKILIPDGILAATVICTSNVILAIELAICALIIFSYLYFHRYGFDFFLLQHNNKLIIRILAIKCMPVFFYAFANTFILNSSKYVIDYYMDDKARFYYAMLLLPATTVHMIVGFIYRPLLTLFASLWENKNINKFNGRVRNIVFGAIGILATVIILAKPVFIPILEFLYDVHDLNNYIMPFIILLFAGGMQAITTLYSYILTIIRGQKHFIWIYTLALMAAAFVPILMVKKYRFVGAALSYFILSLIQMALLIVTFYSVERKAYYHE